MIGLYQELSTVNIVIKSLSTEEDRECFFLYLCIMFFRTVERPTCISNWVPTFLMQLQKDSSIPALLASTDSLMGRICVIILKIWTACNQILQFTKLFSMLSSPVSSCIFPNQFSETSSLVRQIRNLPE